MQGELSGLVCGDGTNGFSRHQELSKLLARPIKRAFARQEDCSVVPFNFKGSKKGAFLKVFLQSF